MGRSPYFCIYNQLNKMGEGEKYVDVFSLLQEALSLCLNLVDLLGTIWRWGINPNRAQSFGFDLDIPFPRMWSCRFNQAMEPPWWSIFILFTGPFGVCAGTVWLSSDEHFRKKLTQDPLLYWQKQQMELLCQLVVPPGLSRRIVPRAGRSQILVK